MGLGKILGSISPAFGLVSGKGLFGDMGRALGAGGGLGALGSMGGLGLLMSLLGGHGGGDEPAPVASPASAAAPSPIAGIGNALASSAGAGGGNYSAGLAGMQAPQAMPSQHGGLQAMLQALGIL